MEDYAMTPRQAAAEVGCSRTTILRAIHKGWLRAEKVKVEVLNQEWYRIKKSDLDVWNSSQYRRKRRA